MSFYTSSGGPPISEAMYNGGTQLGQGLTFGTADTYPVSLITGGTVALTVDTSQNITLAGTLTVTGTTIFSGVIQAAAGTVGAPSLNFTDSTTGFYRAATNQIGVAVSGANQGTFFSGGFQLPAGAVGAPSLTFGDGTTGVYRIGANNLGVTANGSKVLDVATTGLSVVGVFSSSGIASFAAGVKTKVSTANVSTPPTNAEMVSAFGAAATTGAGFIGVVDDNGGHADEFLIFSDGTKYWQITATACA